MDDGKPIVQPYCHYRPESFGDESRAEKAEWVIGTGGRARGRIRQTS